MKFTIRLIKAGVAGACGLVGQAMAAELPSVFTDNMVLQRGQEVRIWGTSDSNKVGVKFNGQTVVADVVNKKWELKLKPMKANTKPQALVVKDSNTTLRLNNVLVGDVFFGSGQSNMEMPVTSSSDCKELVANSQNNQIRICASIQDMSTKPMDYFSRGIDGWHEASPEALATTGVVPKRGFSGTAYSFAYHYQKETKVPVGVFVSAWGGVAIHAYTDAEGIKQYKSKVGARGGKHRVSVLYNTLVHPLTKFNIAGVLWYQGEEDVKCKDYDQRMEIMVERWRDSWGNQDLPFYFVQICPFNYAANPRYKGVKIEDFWRQQRAAEKKIRNAYMVETEDIGNLKDIHPHNKLQVGKRLAKLAIERSSGKKNNL